MEGGSVDELFDVTVERSQPPTRLGAGPTRRAPWSRCPHRPRCRRGCGDRRACRRRVQPRCGLPARTRTPSCRANQRSRTSPDTAGRYRGAACRCRSRSVPVVVALALDVVADAGTEVARAELEHQPRPGRVRRVGPGVRPLRADRQLTGPFIGAAGARMRARLRPVQRPGSRLVRERRLVQPSLDIAVAWVRDSRQAHGRREYLREPLALVACGHGPFEGRRPRRPRIAIGRRAAYIEHRVRETVHAIGLAITLAAQRCTDPPRRGHDSIGLVPLEPAEGKAEHTDRAPALAAVGVQQAPTATRDREHPGPSRPDAAGVVRVDECRQARCACARR